MLVEEVMRLSDGVSTKEMSMILNYEAISFVGPYVFKEKTDEKSCVVVLNNGAPIRINKSMKSVLQKMSNYRS